MAEELGGAEIVEITTSGDRGRGRGDKSRFTKEIEEALLAGEIDIAVHSAKDVPAELPEDFVIAGVPAREDPADCYVGGAGRIRTRFPRAPGSAPPASAGARSCWRCGGSVVGSEELRGNVDTRLAKVGKSVDGA